MGWFWEKPSSCNSFLNNTTLKVAFDRAIYSFLIEYEAIDYCLSLAQYTTPLVRRK
jgi:hypothetical protein